MSRKKNTIKKIVTGVLITLIISGAGFWITLALTTRFVSDVKNQLLMHTETIAAAIDPALIKTQKGERADTLTPEYKILNDQLHETNRISKSIGIKSFYTMFLRDNKITFGVDSLYPGEDGYSDTWDYEEPPAELWSVFKNPTPTLAGPYKDEYGHYYSAFVPIIDPQSKKLLTVFGADIEYDYLNNEVRKQQILPIAITVLMVLLSLGIYLYADHKTESQSILNANLIMVRQEKAKLQALLSGIGDGVVACDTGGKIIFINEIAEKQLQYSQDETAGKSILEICRVVNEQMKPVEEMNGPVYRGMHSGNTMTTDPGMDYNYIRKDGTIFPVAITISPVMGLNKVEGSITVFRDITKEKQLDRMRDEFVSIASHELRTPLGAIKAFVSMIMKGDYGPVTEELKEPMADITTSVNRLIVLVNGMLDLTRIKAGKMNFNIGPFELNKTVDEVVTELRPLALQKKLALNENKTEILTVKSDPDRIRQVLTNLIGNALKFTAEGSITVSVEKEGKTARVRVRDTGIGISKENQEKLFNKFQQLGNTMKDRPQGTGLGLYISREIMHKIGGELILEKSKPGEGSTFAFTLPLA